MKAIALIVAVMVALGAAALAAGPPVIGVAVRKFDHDRHAASAAAGGKPAACASCHELDAAGKAKPKAEHKRCSSCHKFATSCSTMRTPGPNGAARMCAVCHVPTRKACLPDDLPAPPTQVSFTAKFAHGPHLALGSQIEADCARCHKAQAPAVPTLPAHTACSACHLAGGAKPAMQDCESCHALLSSRRSSRPAIAAPLPDPYALDGFDHRAHASASKQAACLGCHEQLVGTGDAAVPRPVMIGCQTRCHDGQKAFAATGTTCTKCHKGSGPATPTRDDVGFSHALHAQRSVDIGDCASCHVLAPDGNLAAPLANKNHLPCANTMCHQTEFAVRTPKICVVCHDAAVPWQKAVSRRGKAPPAIEWFTPMNHAAHVANSETGTTNATCTKCHGDTLAGGAPPRGHAACASCHTTSGLSPPMTECMACHNRTAPASAPISAWSVAATFVHTQHALDPRGGARTSCVGCHTKVAQAKDLTSVPAPQMAGCEGCHDGKVAFKTTGFDCARCHAPKAKP